MSNRGAFRILSGGHKDDADVGGGSCVGTSGASSFLDWSPAEELGRGGGKGGAKGAL